MFDMSVQSMLELVLYATKHEDQNDMIKVTHN